MDGPSLKHKVTVKLSTNHDRPSSRASYTSHSRPASPTNSTLSSRPKAKVNTSALRKPQSSSTTTTTTTVSRPTSPVKFTPRIRESTLSPPVVRAQPTLARAKPSLELRNRSLTASSDALRSPLSETRARQGSLVHHAVSTSNLGGRFSGGSPTGFSPRAQSELGLPPENDANGLPSPTPVRIRSKVTTLASSGTEVTSPITPARPIKTRPRTSSISSTVTNNPNTTSSAPPTPQLYPITTATPAANPHRYITTRTPSTIGSRSSFSFSPSPHPLATFTKQYDEPPPPPPPRLRARVDPVNIPLPSYSPPTSSISFSSSRSSAVSAVSKSSVVSSISSASASISDATTADVQKWNANSDIDSSSNNLRNTLDTLAAYASFGDEDNDRDGIQTGGKGGDDVERKVKAEAKSNRKIADLEITNKSLLAINASLEKTKDRQAKEIRELKRKLRETRLILPPITYRNIKSSLDPSEIGDDEEDLEFEGDEGGDNYDDELGESDDIYKRIKILLEGMLDSGKMALENTLDDHVDLKGAAKVLTAEEVKSWRGSSEQLSDEESHQDTQIFDDDDDDDDSIDISIDIDTRQLSLTPQPDKSTPPLTSNGLLHSRYSTESPQPPPILITEPF